MNIHWNAELPESYRHAAVTPVRFEQHRDASAQASKQVGFDRTGRRCFYRHEFTLTEDRFDAEEFPIQVDVYWERVVAWRLTDGQWLRIKTFADRLDQCPRRFVTQPPELVAEHQLER
ncbi:hypothetical protein [Candidatus Methylocalor cossyra]|uniref:Uncharacterized protein n=1 Tax=Candidatus Methylocalor cossyra TaxID=3108543 RepID=A0ABM9NGR9_9GAMM